MFKKLMLVAVSTVAVFTFGLANTSGVAYADGNGSPVECNSNPNVNPNAGNVLGSQGTSEDSVTVDAGAGNIVEGVCIKSGSNMFGGNQHSGVLGNGTYENGCYLVSGVGTQVATVTRLGSGPTCQGISHVDALVGEADDEEPEEPVVPPVVPSVTGGRGAGEDVTPVAAPAAVTPQAQVPVVPGVNAGNGNGSIVPAVIALGGSLSSIGYGVNRLRKFNA